MKEHWPTEAEVQAAIESAERALDELGGPERRFFDRIRVPPTRWKQRQYPGEGRFWVIAVMGRSCLYCNPVEEGWGWGGFTRWGTISEYHCEQLEIHHVVAQTRHAIEVGDRGDWPVSMAIGKTATRPPRTILKSMQGLMVLSGIALIAAGLNNSVPLVIVGAGLIVLALAGRFLGPKKSTTEGNQCQPD